MIHTAVTPVKQEPIKKTDDVAIVIVRLTVPTLVSAKLCARFKRHLEPWRMLETLCLSDSGSCVCTFGHSDVSKSLRSAWTVAHQAPLSLGFSRQECWSGLPYPPPGDLPDSASLALAGGFFTAEPPGKPRSHSNVSRILPFITWSDLIRADHLIVSGY